MGQVGEVPTYQLAHSCLFLLHSCELDTAVHVRTCQILVVFYAPLITHTSGCREKPRHAAARECYEETLGVLGSASDLAAALKNFEENNVFKVPTQATFRFSIVM